MGNNDEIRPSKPEKPSSPAQDQTNIHVYPDWAAMQAYYGPRVAVPPYFNSAVASGHAPHPYMWGPPQPMMPPYGPPYAAIYAHGGVYAHPGVPLATTSNAETPTKSSGTTDQGLMKKLKGFDGLAMSIGNGNTDSAEDGADNVHSHSTETEGSSDGSNGNMTGVGQNGRKMCREGTPTIGGDEKTETQHSLAQVGGANGSLDKVMDVNFPSSSVSVNVVGTITALELKDPQNGKGGPTSIPGPCAVMSSEAWLQNEKELKRERRKQSNRESARRSRLRKQAEAEELAMRVKSLTAENMTLRSEINRLNENSHKLKLENATLVENLKNVKGGLTEEVVLTNLGNKRPVSTENLLSKVENSGSADRMSEGNEMSENKNSGSRLRQLLKTSPRADAMAAS